MFQRLRIRMFRYFDWPLFLAMLALIVIGIISITAATATTVTDASLSLMDKLEQQTLYYPRLQLTWTVIGMALLAAIMMVNYKFIAKYAFIIYLLNVALLAALFVFAKAGRGNMTGWFGWGDGRTFQPSEIAKLAIIIGLSAKLSAIDKPISTFREMLPLLLYIGLPLVLIFLQPDVGTALVYIFLFGCMLFMSNIKLSMFSKLVGIALLALIPIGFILVQNGSFRLSRILVFLGSEGVSADDAAQTTAAQLAVGSGGLYGKGLFAAGSLAQLGYISAGYTDFVYAVTAESFGFVGGIAVIALFLFMIVRMITLAYKVEDRFASLLIIGVMSMMFFHIFENIGMVIGLTPVTGIPLPFVSYGGSNLLTNILGIGMVLNVSMVCRYRQNMRKLKRERAFAAMSPKIMTPQNAG